MDAPLAGFAISRASGETFAFATTVVAPELVWHWIFVATSTVEADPEAVLAEAERSPGRPWFSVLEDRRGVEPVVRCVELRTPIPRQLRR